MNSVSLVKCCEDKSQNVGPARAVRKWAHITGDCPHSPFPSVQRLVLGPKSGPRQNAGTLGKDSLSPD